MGGAPGRDNEPAEQERHRHDHTSRQPDCRHGGERKRRDK
jgi:hypothetical protein